MMMKWFSIYALTGCIALCAVVSLSFLIMNDIRIASLNVNGARDCRKRAQIYEVANQNKIDVLFLQETHSDMEIAVEWAKEWGGLLFLSHNTSLSGGVAVLFNKNCTIRQVLCLQASS